MSEIKKDLFRIPNGLAYFARPSRDGLPMKKHFADSETFVITEEHTIADVLRYLESVSSKEELISILETMEA